MVAFTDVMNEPHDIDASAVFALVRSILFPFPNIKVEHYSSFKNQAAINGIRASGATTQLILVEGQKPSSVSFRSATNLYPLIRNR
jgi:hypothetical protein